MILFIFLVILAYLMGSICSAVIVCKSCSLPDPREEGSQNPGATNVLRLAGKQYAALVMIADLLKGTIPVLIAKALGASPTVIGFTALAAVLGHVYPAFFHFKGGKGVATAIGALLGIQFLLGVMVAITWLLVAKFSRYSSLASIVSLCLAPFYSLLLIRNLDIFPPIFIITLLILYKHRENITRLIDKKEHKIKMKHNVIEEIMDEQPPTTVIPQESETTVAPPKSETAKPTKTIKTTRKKTDTPNKKTKPKTDQ